jgi:hypothetical protein
MKNLNLKNLFFIVIISLISLKSFSQKGKFESPDMNLRHPITTFDRKNTFEVIRSMILNNTNEFSYYKEIKNKSNYFIGSMAYNSVHTTYSLEELQKKRQDCAFHARSQAFVALIGIDNNNMFGNIDTIRKYYEFALRSLYVLEDNKKIFRKQHSESSHLYRAEELIYSLQAYDMLKAVKELYPNEFTDQYLEIIGGALYNKRKDRHLQYFTRNLYRKSSQIFGIFINHDNHPLIVSAALGMSSLVLHDKGSKRKRQYKWQPIKWANTANWYINNRLWTNSTKSLSYDEGHSGYTEGPGYYQYAFNFLVPYFLTYNNAFEKDNVKDYCLSNNNCESVRNYFYDSKYDNLAKWFNTITLDNDFAPSYDDTDSDVSFSKSAVLRRSQLYNSTEFNFGNNKYDLDIFVSKSSHSVPIHNPSTILHKSGNAIYRTAYDKPSVSINKGRHYFHLLFEPKKSRDNLNWWSSNLLPDYNPSTHEHDDMGSFMIYADEEPLIIDPPYRDFSTHEEVLYPYQHNSLLIKYNNKYEGSSYKTDNAKAKFDYTNPRYRTMEMQYELDRLDMINIKHKLGEAKRTIEVFYDDDSNTEYYYVITDYVNSLENNSNIRMTINGNGIYTNLSENNKHRFKWESNLSESKWGILIENSSLLSNPTFSTDIGYSGLNGFSLHTRQNIDVVGKEAKFITIYRPYLKSVGIQRLTITTNTNDYTSSYIDSIGNDLQIHSHFIKHNQDTTINILNPFGLNQNSYIRTNAQGGFLFLSHNNFISEKCVSNTNFRKADIKSGSFLSYYDSTLRNYISTEYSNTEWDSTCFNKIITSYYEIMSKFKYRGVTFIEHDSCANVSYYLPDIEPGYALKVIDEITGEILPSQLNISTKTITINFGKYMTQFIIQLKDPCLLACYFPPTSETIDSIFNFDNGTTEVLNDDLDIIQPFGFLDISNGSVMSVCENVAFVNSDSLVLTGSEPKYTENYDREGNLIGIDTILFVSKIIINKNSSLVLDSTSITNLNANSQIIVKSGGTLLIKSGAILIIGGKNTSGIANILVEDSAYLCIEEGANISFYDLQDEFVEDNFFRVVFAPQPHTAYEAVNLYSSNGVFDIGGRFDNSICLNLCNIGYENNPYGITNVNYGWSNFIKSKAIILGDTLFCKNEEITFQTSRTINETNYIIKKYHYSDSLEKDILFDSTFYYGRTATITGNNLIGRNKIVLIIDNDCYFKDTIEHIYYVIDTPKSIFSVHTEICPGYGNLQANGAQSSIGRHIWSVERIALYEDDINAIDLDEYDDNESETNWAQEWEFTSEVSSNFNFPGYYFDGGYKYVISLTVFNSCGYSVTSYDTTYAYPSMDIFIYNEFSNSLLEIDTIMFYTNQEIVNNIVLRGVSKLSTNIKWYNEKWELISIVNPSNYEYEESTLILDSPQIASKFYCIANHSNCSDTDSIYIMINNHNLIVSDKSSNICKGTTLKLEAYNYNLLTDAKFEWDNEYLSEGHENPIISLTPDSSTVVRLMITYNDIIEIDYFNITVQDSIKPEITIFRLDSSFCFIPELSDENTIDKIYWDFRDGTPIDSTHNPCHTFPSDTSTLENVCVTIINKCNTYENCFYVNKNINAETPLKLTNNKNMNTMNTADNTRHYNKFSDNFIATPSPFNEYINFEFRLSKIDQNKIFIYDMLGRKVDELILLKETNKIYYDSNHLIPGVYLAKFNSSIIKIIKN